MLQTVGVIDLLSEAIFSTIIIALIIKTISRIVRDYFVTKINDINDIRSNTTFTLQYH